MSWTRIALSLVAICTLGTAVYCSGQNSGNRAMLTASGPIRLSADPVEVHLKSAQSAASIQAVLGALKPDEKIYLVLRGLRINRQPGVVFQILQGSLNEKRPSGENPMGTFNFFSVPENTASATITTPDRTTRTFEITQTLRNLPSSAKELVITIRPSGAPAADSSPSIAGADVVIAR